MEKPISRQAHGAIDYAFGAIVAALPELAGFKEEKSAATLCRVLAGGALAYSLLTKAEWGAVKVIPFKTHLLIDFTTGLLTLGAPWILGFANNTKARNAVLAVGAMSLMASSLTEQEEM
jgi:hypothetical protein